MPACPPRPSFLFHGAPPCCRCFHGRLATPRVPAFSFAEKGRQTGRQAGRQAGALEATQNGDRDGDVIVSPARARCGWGGEVGVCVRVRAVRVRSRAECIVAGGHARGLLRAWLASPAQGRLPPVLYLYTVLSCPVPVVPLSPHSLVSFRVLVEPHYTTLHKL